MPRTLVAVLLVMGLGTTAAFGGQVFTGSEPSSSAALDAPTAPKSPDRQTLQTHTVVKGETLKDIAKKYYQDPGEWRRILQANKSLKKTPPALKPGQVLVIPRIMPPQEKPKTRAAVPVVAKKEMPPAVAVPEKKEMPVVVEERTTETRVVVSEPESPAEPAPEPAAPPETASPAPEPKNGTVPTPAVKKYFDAEGMTVPKGWKGDGFIIGEKDKKYLISQGDTVYLNLGANRVKPGTQLMVYRKSDKLHDPETGDVLGYEVRRIGRLEVTNSIEPASSSAKVIMSYEPIETGDMVKILGAE